MLYEFGMQITTFCLSLCSKRGFDVRSFGTGSHVKLPGPSPDKPNVYDFKTTYEQMYNDLVRKDKELYPLHSPFFLLHMHTFTQIDRKKYDPFIYLCVVELGW